MAAKDEKNISILGSGPAGLAYAYFAQKAGKNVTIYEKSNIIGGNCITTCKEGFCWDSGAHRIHNVYKDVTDDIKNILENELQTVHAPSHIYFKNRFIPFPFHILNVVKTFGLFTFFKASAEVLFGSKKTRFHSFKDYAVSRYGKTLAQPLLINYTEKLWGVAAEKLSTQVTGKRLNGLTPWQWLAETIFRHIKTGKHLEGSFYYPVRGIGQLTEKMGQKIGLENIKTQSAVTKIYHHDNIITHIEINNQVKEATKQAISTLPLPLFARLLHPPLPESILQLAQKLQFRNLIIVAFAINKPSVSASASIYFPGEHIFTRVVEPKNRSVWMSPENRTSLVAEIPCFSTDEIWQKTDDEIIETAKTDLVKTGLCQNHEITNAWIQRMPFAYPMLSCDAVENLSQLQEYFARFQNLNIAGRNGNFAYTHIHDLFHEAKLHFSNNS